MLITFYPKISCYHMRPEDAWNLPFDLFRELSDIQLKRIEEWNRNNG